MCITHELSTIRDADVILFFNKDTETGVTTITGTGTYDELLSTCDTFRRWHEFKWPDDTHDVAHGVDEHNSLHVSGALDDTALLSRHDDLHAKP